MGVPFNRRTLLVRGAAAAGSIAGASVLGLDLADMAGATTAAAGAATGSPRPSPRRAASLVFGVDAEESGFNPTTARFDEVGVMYARTVFDPLTIIDTKGAWQPYLAQSVTPNADHTAWTITVRPNVVFHDGTPLDGAALLTNFKAQQASLLQGLILNPIVASVTQSGPLAVTLNLKSPWVSLPAVPGGRGRGPVRLHGRPVHAGGAQRWDIATGGHRALRLQGVGAQQPLHGHGQPPLLAAGPALPRRDHLQADRRRGSPGRSPQVGDHRHPGHRHAAGHHAVPWQQELRLRRRQQASCRPARHELRAPQPGRADPSTTPRSAAPRPWRSIGPSTPRRSTRTSSRSATGCSPRARRTTPRPSYPAYNPTEAKKLVKQVAEEHRETGQLHLGIHQLTDRRTGTAVPPAGLAERGLRGQERHRRAEQPDQQGPGGHLPGARVAPVRRRRPGPQLHLLEQHDDPVELARRQHGPQQRPPARSRPRAGANEPQSRPRAPRRTRR